jgi:hypothetical protein
MLCGDYHSFQKPDEYNPLPEPAVLSFLVLARQIEINALEEG